jgi:FkbM family methyltransferase
MNLKYRLNKRYTQLLFRMSESENRFYLFFFRYLFKPANGSLDEFLDEYSKKHSPVTFLQVGANDGLIHDPLHKFIKRDNWKGIMLEPQPEVFNDFLIRVHKKRPEITPVNAALDAHDGTKTLYTLGISAERWATGMSSFNREVLVNKIKKGTIQYKANKRGIRLPGKEDDMIVGREVATISPETLLKKFGEERFKLLAIDTEGFDFEILKMLDLGRISPEVIIYEEVNFDKETALACRAYLEQHGYSCRSIGKDALATLEIPLKAKPTDSFKDRTGGNIKKRLFNVRKEAEGC